MEQTPSLKTVLVLIDITLNLEVSVISLYTIANEVTYRYFGGVIFSYNSSITSVQHAMNSIGERATIPSTFHFNFSSQGCHPMSNNSSIQIDSQLIQTCNETIGKMSGEYYVGENESLCLSCRHNINKNDIVSNSLRFYYNSAKKCGGSMFSISSSMKLIGTIEFVGNSAEFGGVIFLRNASFGIIGSKCLRYSDSSSHFSNNILFLNNSARLSGGALLVVNSNLTMYGNICLVNNYARFFGGALYIVNLSILLNLKRLSN